MPRSLSMPSVRLDPRRPPPAGYYADNLLTVIETVLDRYDDILTDEERDFGLRVRALAPQAQRLLARLLGRASARDGAIREDSLDYPEVEDLSDALAELAACNLIERCPAMPADIVVGLLTRPELHRVFWDLDGARKGTKADHLDRILAVNPPCFCRWRVRRFVGWLRFAESEFLDLYRLLFFGDRHQDLTTFVLRDLGVHRYEPVNLSRETRQFPDRETLGRFLDLAAADDAIRALFPRGVADVPLDDTVREDGGGRSRTTTLDATRQPDAGAATESRAQPPGSKPGAGRGFRRALACYARSTLAPARERRMRILHRLGDGDGVEQLRAEVFESPWAALEDDFARRFARPFRRRAAPVEDLVLTGSAAGIEAQALAHLTAEGGVGWHLENHLPMGVFALAYWSWLFAPLPGAFVNAFQTGPVDLYWPDFLKSREAICEDPLDGALKPQLEATARAKAGIANRLFSWHRYTAEVAEAVTANIPESDLRALVGIVREDLAGKRSGFPDLTVIYGPGRYEFVEVKGPGDQLQIHQRLWIEALERRGLPVRVLRYRRLRELA